MKKRVLHISKYYFPFAGGIEQVCRDFVNSLKDDYEQMVICFNHEKGDLVDSVDDIKVVRAGCFAKISSQSLSFSYGKLLKKCINEFKPDLVVFHYPNPFVAELLLKYKKKKNFKLALYWHLDITKQKILGKLFHHQNIKLIQMSDSVIGATKMHMDSSKYYEYFKDKLSIIPNAIDESSLQITDEEIGNAKEIKERNEGKTICYFIGRHVPYKGLEYLVKASKLLDDKYKIYIAGVGPLTDSLKALANGDNKIEFLGKVSSSERRIYLYACDVFCFPSITKNESFGLALAEAMYYEKPAITFTIKGSGVNFVNIDGQTGIECRNSDYEAYANAIQTLRNNEELRIQYGKSARERVLANFTFKDFKINVSNYVLAIIGK